MQCSLFVLFLKRKILIEFLSVSKDGYQCRSFIKAKGRKMNFRKVGHTCIQRAIWVEQREQLILTVMGESKISQRKTYSLAFKGDQVWRGDSREKLAWTRLRWRECRENSENHKVSTFEGWVIPFQPFYFNSKFSLNIFWPQFLFHMDLEHYAGIKEEGHFIFQVRGSL